MADVAAASPGEGRSAARTAVIYSLLITGNVLAWLWAVMAFHGQPVLFGAAALAYTFGLRHAVDADHIAAIDNVTRKLVQQGRRPVSVGLWFSLGHSTVVVLACIAIAMTSVALRAHFANLRNIGSVVGTGISAAFLFFIAIANLVTLVSVWRAYRAARKDGDSVALMSDVPLLKPGVMGRILRPLLRLISAPRHMYLLGFLFGLGFDTASEIGLLGISASQASQSVPFWTIMVFPALFTAGMSLVDTTDGVLMVGAYGWALVEPVRKLFYNLAVTLFSILVALIIGALEALNLLADHFALRGAFWHWVGDLNDHFGAVGCLIIAALLSCWALSSLLSRSAGATSQSA